MIDMLTWIKSSYTGSQGNCVEVASLPDGGRAIRDSKNPDGRHLMVSPSAWRRFTNQIKAGRLG
jgi:hypothetical protein